MLASGAVAQESAGSLTADRVRGAVLPVLETGLATSGVQLLNATVDGDRVTLDLSKDFLALGQGRNLDEAVRKLAGAVAATPADSKFFRFTVTVEGAPLRQAKAVTLPSAPAMAARRMAAVPKTAENTPQARVLVLNPALDGTAAEGTVAAELAMSLREALSGESLEVLSTRNLDKYAGTGDSGAAKWQEAAVNYLKELGVPDEIVAAGDWMSRPLFANWSGADVLMTLHSSSNGVPVIFYSSEGASPADSRAYAAAAQARMAGSVLVDCADCAVELRIAEMPSVVVDLGLGGVEATTQLAASGALKDTIKTLGVTSNGLSASTPAAMTAPTPGSTLTGADATFQWAPSTDATNYWLMVGTYLGGNTLYSADQGTLTSATVTGLPTDGRTLYVRLWSYINSTWVSNDYTYRAYAPQGVVPTKAAITSPAAGSTLSGASVTFNWNTGVAVSRYYLHVGAWQGGNTLYSADLNTATTAAVSGLPVDGSTVYARLWSYIDGVWQYNDTTYTAFGSVTPVKAAITSPSAGSKLAGSSVTFNWNTGSAVTRYYLHVGLWQGGNTIATIDAGNATSAAVTGLPSDASTVYVRLWSYINGSWQYNDYTYTAAGTAPTGVKAAMISPASGTKFANTSVTFTWNAGTAVTRYWLMVGTAVGNNDIYGGDQNMNTSATVTVPATGKAVYVRLWSYIYGAWQYSDYAYTASN